MKRASLWTLCFSLIVLTGCGPSDGNSSAEEKAIEAERAKLSPEDRALVQAQEWCPISIEERLGSMGEPVKLVLKGQPVFLCCKSCRRRAEANPDETLKTVLQFKAKVKQEK